MNSIYTAKFYDQPASDRSYAVFCRAPLPGHAPLPDHAPEQTWSTKAQFSDAFFSFPRPIRHLA